MEITNRHERPDRFVPSKEEPWLTISKMTGSPNIVYRMCRTPDCQRVVGAWMLYEDINAKFDERKGWSVPTNARPPKYEIRNFPGKGRGMVARRKIEEGELIVQERPIIMAPMAVHTGSPDPSSVDEVFERGLLQLLYWLEPSDRQAFLSLTNCKSPAEGGLLRGIVHTNGIGVEFKDVDMESLYNCVTLQISMVNHSCSANARYEVNPADPIVQLLASRDIAAEEEITISYVDSYAPCARRKESLFEDYRFECRCLSCSLPASMIEESDARRKLIRKTLSMDFDTIFQSWLAKPASNSESRMSLVKHLTAVIDAMDKEGLHTYRLQVITRLANAYAALGDDANFRRCAQQVVKALRHSKNEAMQAKWKNWSIRPNSVPYWRKMR